MNNSNIKKWAQWYFYLQGLAGLLLWLCIYLSPEFAAYFKLSPQEESSVFALLLPDMLIFVALSFLTAYWIQKNDKRYIIPGLIHLGGAVYGTLFYINVFLLYGISFMGVFGMASVTVIILFFVVKLLKDFSF